MIEAQKYVTKRFVKKLAENKIELASDEVDKLAKKFGVKSVEKAINKKISNAKKPKKAEKTYKRRLSRAVLGLATSICDECKKSGDASINQKHIDNGIKAWKEKKSFKKVAKPLHSI